MVLSPVFGPVHVTECLLPYLKIPESLHVFILSPRGGGLRQRSSRRPDPVGPASTNCSTSGRSLPGSLATGGLPGAVRRTQSGKHCQAESAARFRQGIVADSVVFMIPPRPANVSSLAYRCRGKGNREPGACGGRIHLIVQCHTVQYWLCADQQPNRCHRMRRSPHVDALPRGTFAGVSRGSTDRPARREAFRVLKPRHAAQQLSRPLGTVVEDLPQPEMVDRGRDAEVPRVFRLERRRW